MKRKKITKGKLNIRLIIKIYKESLKAYKILRPYSFTEVIFFSTYYMPITVTGT